MDKIIIAAIVLVLINGMYQSMTKEPHTCDACVQLHTEVTQ
jgi:hypothetical protein